VTLRVLSRFGIGSPFSFLRARAANRVIARSETTKQSPFVKRGRLLRCARNDKFDRNRQPRITERFGIGDFP